MNKSILLLLVSSFFIFSCNKSKKANSSTKEPIQVLINNSVDSLLSDPKINSVSIGIYNNSKTYINHYGELTKGTKDKPNNNTLYEIGSVSKTFAGLLIAQAEIDGKLNIEDNIQRYLPQKYNNLSIKIKDLLVHTSGLPNHLPKEMNLVNPIKDNHFGKKVNNILSGYSKEDFFQDLHNVKLSFLPGSKYKYSSVDTEILAVILEKVYNEEYDNLLKKYLNSKINMPNTKIILSPNEERRLAKGYDKNNLQAPSWKSNLWGASGKIKSTMPDLINYMKFQLNDENPVIKKSHSTIYKNDKTQMGYCWNIGNDSNEGTYYGHHGGMFGTQTIFYIFPKHNLGVCIIINQGDTKVAPKLFNSLNNILDGVRK